MQLSRTVILLTDFGLADPYVGQMKAALLGLAPAAPIIDLCHEIEPYNLAQAGFFLEASRPYFPEASICVAVVDPGVGTPRRIVLLDVSGRLYLAPDNGLLSLLLDSGVSIRAWDLSDHARTATSATFHGRDVFAPLAALLARGATPESLGPDLDPGGLVRLPWSRPVLTVQEDGQLLCHVLHVDRFGNIILNLAMNPWLARVKECRSVALIGGSEQSDLQEGSAVALVRTYDDIQPGGYGLLAGSQGFLELAMNRSSAAAALGLSSGSQLCLAFQA